MCSREIRIPFWVLVSSIKELKNLLRRKHEDNSIRIKKKKKAKTTQQGSRGVGEERRPYV